MDHGNNEKSLSLEELLSGVWRRRKTALLVTAAALVLGALYVICLLYTSDAADEL